MSIHHLDRLFHPQSVAVVGASERPGSAGAALLRNLIEAGYAGTIYPVNKRYRSLMGYACHRSIAAIGAPVDLVVVVTPIASVPGIVQQCAQEAAGGVLIITPGGKETGPQGTEMERQINAAAAGTPLRIIGPGSMGLVCSRCKLNASIGHKMPPAGRLAFISQSGALAMAIFDSAEKEGIGFSFFVSLGAMMDVHLGDAIDYLGNDGRVSSIVLYMEQLCDPRRFMSAARAVSNIKPIIALKAGRTRPGALAAMRHTGAAAGEDDIYDCAFRRAGILRVKTFEELFDCAELVAKQPHPRRAGLVIVSNAGGPAVMAADALSDHGVEPAPLAPDTMALLEKLLAPLWSRANPVDIRGNAAPESYLAVVDIVLKAPEVDGLLIIFSPNALNDPTETARILIPRLQASQIPVITAWLGGGSIEAGRDLFNQAGIPTFDSPERAVRAFMDLYHYARNLEMHRQIPAKLPHRLKFDRHTAEGLIQKQLSGGDPWMSEVHAKQLLAAYGVPINPTYLAANLSQAVALADRAGYPAVLKIDSPGQAHISHWGGVRLNLSDQDQVRQAYTDLMNAARSSAEKSRIRGITVQKMVGAPSAELALGIHTDDHFGPVLSFGWGGIARDISQDRAYTLPPLNRLLARRMIEGAQVYRLLKGYRDHAPANIALLEEILIRLAQLATDFAQIAEIAINPLLVVDQNFCAVSARVRVYPASVRAPLHLVIAPYPNQYETVLNLHEEGPIQIRPIRPEDAPLLKAFFASLSSKSIYYRFFSPLKELPREMLARFTQIDYDREIAMVAIQENQAGDDEMLGVGRIISGIDPTQAEFAILVGDRWHGRGIGAALLRICLQIARIQGVHHIWGAVMSDNTQMLALGRKLGFKMSRANGEYELRMNLSDMPTALNDVRG